MKLGNGVIRHDPGVSTRSRMANSNGRSAACGGLVSRNPGVSTISPTVRIAFTTTRIVERHLVLDPLVVELGARRAQHDCFDPVGRRPTVSIPALDPEAERGLAVGHHLVGESS